MIETRGPKPLLAIRSRQGNCTSMSGSTPSPNRTRWIFSNAVGQPLRFPFGAIPVCRSWSWIAQEAGPRRTSSSCEGGACSNTGRNSHEARFHRRCRRTSRRSISNSAARASGRERKNDSGHLSESSWRVDRWVRAAWRRGVHTTRTAYTAAPERTGHRIWMPRLMLFFQ